MNYQKLDSLSFFQIDHTSRCNLLCLQCARNERGQINKNLPLDELSLIDYKTLFNKGFMDLVPNLNHIIFNGNYGDAIISDTLMPAIEYLKSLGIKKITIMTNGSLRNSNWWISFAQILNDNDKVVFSIDGLADTNYLYRVNSSWDKIIENATAFIGAGGKARWDFLVFEHNFHQIEEAKKIAKQIGFSEFSVKKTSRFINDKNYKNGQVSLSEKVSGKDRVYEIATPTHKTEFMSQSTIQFENIFKKHGSWEKYIDNTEINCKYKQWGGGLFIDFQARLWPCTWLASPLHHFHSDNTQKIQILQLLEKYGYNFNSLRHKTFDEVYTHEWFQNELVQSWQSSTTQWPMKMMTCGRTCGQEYDFSSASKNNRIIEKL